MLTVNPYADLEIRILERQEAGYPVEITLNGDQHFPRGFLAAKVLPWTSGGNAQADGERLFAALLGDGLVREAWARARGQHLHRRVRLRLDTTAPELHTLPWELLHDGETWLAADATTPFSRYLPLDMLPSGAPSMHSGKIRVLAVIANLVDLKRYNFAPLDVLAEQQRLTAAFTGLPPARLHLDFLDAPVTLERLEQRLADDYHILHFIGHGMFSRRRRQVELYLQDDTGNTRVVGDAELSAMFKRQAQLPCLVFLSACESATRTPMDAFTGLAAQLVQAGVPAVVAMQDQVAIAATGKLTSTFYAELIRHGAVDRALNVARSLLLTGQSPDAGVPVLLMRLKDGRVWAPLWSLNPYRGLAAYTEADAGFFFGREKLVHELIAHLRNRNPRFLVVVGPSGSGKSSVVQAGLIPALRQGVLYGSQEWRIVPTRPGDEADLSRLLKLGKAKDPRQVLFIDQFEELFTQCTPAIQSHFLNDLQTLIEGDTPITVILALRADFYGHFLRHPLGQLLNEAQVNVLPMGEEDLRAAIETPAQQVDLRFEAGLVDTIVADAQQAEHTLPLLQSALAQLWQRQEQGVLTYAAYEAIGRVAGALGFWAEETYHHLSEADRLLAQHIFTRLVHYGEIDALRRRSLEELVPSPEENETVHTLVHSLADTRLLVTGDETVEIIHAALLREWGRLQEWIAAQREFYLWRQRLEAQRRLWEETERDAGALLRGALLVEAEHRAQEQPDELNPAERAYIVESMTYQKQEQSAQGRRRRRIVTGLIAGLFVMTLLAIFAWGQMRQAKWSQATAETARVAAVNEAYSRATAQAETEAQRAEAEEARGTAVAEAAFRATAQAESEARRIEAERAKATAQTEAAIARSREIAAISVAQLEVDAERSLLLAIEAVETHHTTQAEEALRHSLVDSRVRATLYGHGGYREILVWNPTGKYMATTSSNNVIQIWDMTQLTLTTTLRHTQGSILSVVWSPNGSYIAATFNDGGIWVWNVQTGEVADTLMEYSVSDLSWDPQSRYLAFGGCALAQMEAGTPPIEEVLIWEVFTEDQPLSIGSVEPASSSFTRNIWTVAWNPNGKYLAAGLDNGCVKVWDVTTGQETTVVDSSQSIISLAWSPDKKQLAILDYGKLYIWNIETGNNSYTRAVHINSASSGMRVMAWSPNGKVLAFKDQNNTITLWNIDKGTEVVLTGHTTDIHALAWDPHGRQVTSISSDGIIRLWDIAYGDSITMLAEGMGYAVESIGWNPQGTSLALNYDRIKVWDLSSREYRNIPDSRPYNAVTWDGSGKKIAFDYMGNAIHIWDVVDWEELLVLDPQSSLVREIAWNPQHPLLAAAFGDGKLQVWDTTSGDKVKTIEPSQTGQHGNGTGSVAWNATGDLLAFSLQEPVMWLWDRQTDKEMPVDIPNKRLVYDLAWSPDGTKIAVAAVGVHIWDVKGTKLFTFTIPYGTSQGAQSVTWSPDGNHLACGYSDGIVRIWDINTGKNRGILTEHTGAVISLTWSPDGRRLASGSRDFTARMYCTDIQDLLTIAHQQVSWQISSNGSRQQRQLTSEERYLYLGESPSP